MSHTELPLGPRRAVSFREADCGGGQGDSEDHGTLGDPGLTKGAATQHSWSSHRRPVQIQKVGWGRRKTDHGFCLAVACQGPFRGLGFLSIILSPHRSICGSWVCSRFLETRKQTQVQGFAQGCCGRQISDPPKMSPSSFLRPGLFHVARGVKAAGVIKAASRLPFRWDYPGVSRCP